MKIIIQSNLMQKNKIYSLKLNINIIESSLLTPNSKYSLMLTQNSHERRTPVLQAQQPGRLVVNQCFEFSISETQLDRDSKCLIQLSEENREGTTKQIGTFQLTVMEYKNYSKKAFKMTSKQQESIELHMNISINSNQEKKSVQRASKSVAKGSKSESRQSENGEELRWMKAAIFESPVSVNSQLSEFSQKCSKKKDEFVIKSPLPLQMDNIFKYIGGKKPDVDGQVQRKHQQFKGNVLTIPSINIKKTLQDQSRAVIESRYCKQLQQELDLFSQKSANIQIQSGFFDSLHRIKQKFEKIYVNEELLLSDDLYHKEEAINDQKKINCCLKKIQEKGYLGISTCFSYKLQLSNPYDSKLDVSHLSARKRYQIAKTGNLSPLNQTIAFKHNPCLSESQLNFEVQEESLNRVSYIKLNKISHLTRAADIARKNNSFLLKANEQLKLALKVAEEKLDIAKKISSQKEEILQSQFKAVKEYIRTISNKLSFGQEQTKKRQEKVVALQQQVQKYTREINNLKAEIKANNTTIKDLKTLLACREEKDQPSISIKDTLADTKETRNRVARIHNSKEQEQISITYSIQKRPNSVRLFQEGKVRKKSSIQNEIKVTEVEDKSDVGSQKTYRRFSRSKVQSNSVIEHKSIRTGTYLKTDDIFCKLNELLLGNSETRVLKDL